MDSIGQARSTLQAVRTEIAKFQRLRTANNEVISGLRQGLVPQEQAAQLASSYRDAGMEQQAVAQLGELIRVLRSGQDGAVDLSDPLPPALEDNLGALPLAIPIVIALGAGVYSGFSFLRAREERLLAETRGPVAEMIASLTSNTWALALVGALGLGGFIWWDLRRGGRRQPARLARLQDDLRRRESLGTAQDLQTRGPAPRGLGAGRRASDPGAPSDGER